MTRVAVVAGGLGLVVCIAAAGCSTASTATDDSTPTSAAPASPTPVAAAPATATSLPTAPATTPGCVSPSAEVPQAGSTTQITLDVDGTARTYRLHVPVGYDPSTGGVPVVVSMHGMGADSASQLLFTGITADSDAQGYVVIAPEAINGMWQLPAADGTEGAASPEVGYIDAVLADAGAKLCLDPTRYYASGMSLGSAMTLVLACQPERRFAAFGGVGAAFYDPACNAAPPAPLIYFHGTDDDVVPFEGGEARGYEVAPATETMADWATHNSCAVPPTESTTNDVIATTWTSCALAADIDFYTVIGGGHTWPGSPVAKVDWAEQYIGRTTSTVSATAAMWEFFRGYALPSADAPDTSGVPAG